MRQWNLRSRWFGLSVAVLALLAVGGAYVGVAANSGDPRPVAAVPAPISDPIDPSSLTMPPSVPRSAWVDENGVINEAKMPPPPARDPWVRDDGSIDCSAVSKTIGIVAQDGRIILDGAGREVRIPNLNQPGDCGPQPSVALQQAWMEKANAIANKDAAARGLPPVTAPKVEAGTYDSPSATP